ncbi:MAG: hypothetical protein PHU25_04750 [Deltaproteobacteria bacterium]|nr:hypothetical protein [Deltaproteobacteria bacterium]
MGRPASIEAGALGVVTLLVAACTNVGDYSTSLGECYSGSIIDATFVRDGFGTGVKMSLTLDVDALGRGARDAGHLVTSDGTFQDARLSQMDTLEHDTLSLLQFPGGRVRNYLAYATPAEGPAALVVVSLMEDETMEVRVMRPKDEQDAASKPLFGVFKLMLLDECGHGGGS